jgi:uncharacterized protein (TIGR02596 family)
MDQVTSHSRASAFSLIELMIVIALLGLLTVLAVPALNSVMRGSNINLAGQTITDQLALARQDAVTRNRDVQVRFYRMTNGSTPGWRAVQLWRIDQGPTGPTTNAIGRLVQIPEGIIIATNNSLSPLITTPSFTGTTNLPGYGPTPYAGFRFRANGSLESTVTAARGYLTLAPASDTNETPVNYFTIQLNPLTGKTLIFRP